MADKLTQLLTEALSRAATDPTGVPLYGTKSDPGLFPNTTTAKPVAQKALDDGYLTLVRTETKGKTTRDLCAATEKGLRFLLEQVSPKQVLGDFVRVLEQRGEQVTELLAAANRMAETLAGLKAAVTVVLPQVQSARIPSADYSVFSTSPTHSRLGPSAMNGAATLEAAVATETDDLAGAILTRLADWAASAVAGQDCPLPELFRSLTTRELPPTIGVFHDCLRQLHDEHRIYLHPWTGPLYALPEPAYALLVGHNVAYYASGRTSLEVQG